MSRFKGMNFWLKLFFSYEIRSCADADSALQTLHCRGVWSICVKCQINWISHQFASRCKAGSGHQCVSFASQYANMQRTTNFWTDRCEVRFEICIYSTFFFFKAVVIYWCTCKVQNISNSNNIIFAFYLPCSAYFLLAYCSVVFLCCRHSNTN